MDDTTVYLTTGVVTSTLTTGSPPVTTTREMSTTQVTVTDTITIDSFVPSKTTTKTVTSGTQTVTRKHTVTVSPTATATITLFSLQIYNTSVAVDDYTIGIYSDPTYSVADVQNMRTWRFYIDPVNHRLYEYPSRRHAVYYFDGGDEDYEHDFLFLNGPIDDPVGRMTCHASCGSALTCVDIDAIDGGGQVPLVLIESLELGAKLSWDDVEDWPAVQVKAVAPKRGRI